MTYTLPNYVTPLLDFYGLKWPDVDEDQVRDVGLDVKALADAAHEFAGALAQALDALVGETEAEALRAMHEFWSDFADGPVLKATDAIGEGAATACGAASDGILAYKGAITACLFVNCASDIALIMTGVGAPLAAAKKVAMRAALEAFLDDITAQFADYLLGQFNKLIDDLVFNPIDDLVNKIRSEVVTRAATVIAMSTPVHTGTVGVASLYIDHDDVIHAANRMKKAYEGLHSALVKVIGYIKEKDLVAPAAAAPDPVVRTVLQQAMDWLAEQLLQLLVDIAQETVDQVIETICGIYERYVEADASLAAAADQLRSDFKFPPRSNPFHIDRSTQPKPIYILDAPPMVVTGPGVSDARNGIVVIDLPDRDDPVVTGVAESDARFDIREILLAPPPEPVTTGPAISDARDDIQEIVLPSARAEE